MWNGFCGDLIRRTNQRLLVLVLAILAGLLIFYGFNRAYFNGFFTGPHAASDAEVVAAQSAKDFPNAIVTVNGGTTTNPRVAEYSKDDSHPDGYISARYLTTEVGGKLLMVRVDPDTPLAQDPPAGQSADQQQSQASGTFTGQVHAFNDDLGGRIAKANQAGGNYLTYYLDTYNYSVFGWTSAIIGGALLLGAAWGALLYVKRNANPAEHPFAKGLAKYGVLEAVVPQLDAQLSAAHTTFRYGAGGAEVTSGWYVVTSAFGASAAPLSALVWVHRRIVKRRVYFVIPAGTQQSLVAFDRFGKRLAANLKQSQIDELMPLLRNVAPQAIYGYDKRVMKLWRTGRRNPDRTAFITEARAMLSGQALPEAVTTSLYQ
jgi:hypothetical protein